MDTNGKDSEGKLARQEARPPTIYEYLNKDNIKAEIAKGLSGSISPERFVRVVMTSLRANPRLAQCTTESIMGAIMISAQLGLEPNTPLGQAHIIPYRNGKTGQYEATFQLGYAGLLELAYRTGEYQSITVREVYANDHFRYAYGLDPILEHVPADEPDGDPVKYYAAYRLKNGGSSFEVWSKEKVEKHRGRFSRAKSDGPWVTDFPAMAKKTVLRAVLKYAPKTIELAERITVEEIEEHAPEPAIMGAALQEMAVTRAPAIEAPDNVKPLRPSDPEPATDEQRARVAEAAQQAGIYPDEVIIDACELYGIDDWSELTGPMAEALVERYARPDTPKPSTQEAPAETAHSAPDMPNSPIAPAAPANQPRKGSYI